MSIFFDPNEKQYCGNCREVLQWEVYATYYDHRDGEKYHHYRFTCPKWRWWHFTGFFGGHARWRCDQDGSTYSYEA